MLENISPPASPPAPAEQAESLRYNLFVSIQSCQNLPARKHGTSDPFVKFTVGGKMVHRTKTMKSELNPVWDEVFVAVVSELGSPLEVKVYSQNLVKDDLLGQHSLDLSCLPLNTALHTSVDKLSFLDKIYMWQGQNRLNRLGRQKNKIGNNLFCKI